MKSAAIYLLIFLSTLLFSCRERYYGIRPKGYDPMIRFSQSADTLCLSPDKRSIYFGTKKFKQFQKKAIEQRQDPGQLKPKDNDPKLLEKPVNYEVTYTEHMVMKDNLLEIVNSNKNQVDSLIKYDENFKPYFQVLYLKDLNLKYPTDSNYSAYAYTYHSLKYKTRKRVVAVGKSYLGLLDKAYPMNSPQLDPEGNNPAYLWKITFGYKLSYKRELKGMFKRQARYKIERIKGEKPKIVFFIRPDTSDTDKPGSKGAIHVETVIVKGNNKIGGPKSLVYPVSDIMRHPDALRFKIQTQPVTAR